MSTGLVTSNARESTLEPENLQTEGAENPVHRVASEESSAGLRVIPKEDSPDHFVVGAALGATFDGLQTGLDSTTRFLSFFKKSGDGSALRSLEDLNKEIARLQSLKETQQGEELKLTLEKLAQLELVMELFSQMEQMPLSEDRRDFLKDKLIEAINREDPAEFAKALELVTLWGQYAEVAAKREGVQGFLAEAYPQEYREDEVRQVKTLEKDAFTLARRALSEADQDHLAAVLADEGELAEPKTYGKLLSQIDHLEGLYQSEALGNFFAKHKEIEDQLIAEDPSLGWEHVMSATAERLPRYAAELKSIEEDIQLLEGVFETSGEEEISEISERAKGYQEFLLSRKASWDYLETKLAEQVSDTEQALWDSYYEEIHASDDEINLGDGVDEHSDPVDHQALIQADPALVAARQNLALFRSSRETLEELKELDWSNSENLSFHLETLAAVVDTLADIEGVWYEQQVEQELTNLESDVARGDASLAQLHQRWEGLLAHSESSSKDYKTFLNLLNLQKDLCLIESLGTDSSRAMLLHKEFGNLLAQAEPSEQAMALFAARLQIHKSFAGAKALNPKHPKVIELRKELQAFDALENPSAEDWTRIMRLSQTAALATNVETKLKVWDEKVESAHLTDRIINTTVGFINREERFASSASPIYKIYKSLGGEGFQLSYENHGAESVVEIHEQYSRVQDLLAEGRLEEAQRLFTLLERDPSVRAWFQTAQDAATFNQCTITAAIVVASGGAAGILSSYVGGLGIAASNGARGLQLLGEALTIARNAERLQEGLRASLLLRSAVFGTKVVSFTGINQYLENRLHDKPFFDPKLSWEENLAEFGKDSMINAGMFAALGWAMRAYQRIQMVNLLPEAQVQFQARVGAKALARMSSEEIKAGLRAQLENMTRTGWSGLKYQVGAFGAELGGFGLWDPVGMLVEANYQSIKAGEGFALINTMGTLFSLEDWKHRFTFLVALKAGGALAHPLPKPLADPIAEASYARVLQARTKLATAFESNPDQIISEALGDLRAALQAQIDYLDTQKSSPANRQVIQESREALQTLEELRQELEMLTKLLEEGNAFGITRAEGKPYAEYHPAKQEALFDQLTKQALSSSWTFYPENGLFEITVKDPNDPTGKKTTTLRLMPREATKSEPTGKPKDGPPSGGGASETKQSPESSPSSRAEATPADAPPTLLWYDRVANRIWDGVATALKTAKEKVSQNHGEGPPGLGTVVVDMMDDGLLILRGGEPRDRSDKTLEDGTTKMSRWKFWEWGKGKGETLNSEQLQEPTPEKFRHDPFREMSEDFQVFAVDNWETTDEENLVGTLSKDTYIQTSSGTFFAPRGTEIITDKFGRLLSVYTENTITIHKISFKGRVFFHPNGELSEGWLAKKGIVRLQGKQIPLLARTWLKKAEDGSFAQGILAEDVTVVINDQPVKFAKNRPLINSLTHIHGTLAEDIKIEGRSYSKGEEITVNKLSSGSSQGPSGSGSKNTENTGVDSAPPSSKPPTQSQLSAADRIANGIIVGAVGLFDAIGNKLFGNGDGSGGANLGMEVQGNGLMIFHGEEPGNTQGPKGSPWASKVDWSKWKFWEWGKGRNETPPALGEGEKEPEAPEPAPDSGRAEAERGAGNEVERPDSTFEATSRPDDMYRTAAKAVKVDPNIEFESLLTSIDKLTASQIKDFEALSHKLEKGVELFPEVSAKNQENFLKLLLHIIDSGTRKNSNPTLRAASEAAAHINPPTSLRKEYFEIFTRLLYSTRGIFTKPDNRMRIPVGDLAGILKNLRSISSESTFESILENILKFNFYQDDTIDRDYLGYLADVITATYYSLSPRPNQQEFIKMLTNLSLWDTQAGIIAAEVENRLNIKQNKKPLAP